MKSLTRQLKAKPECHLSIKELAAISTCMLNLIIGCNTELCHSHKWGIATALKAMTILHAQKCDTDLSRSYGGAGLPEHRLLWSQSRTLSLSHASVT